MKETELIKKLKQIRDLSDECLSSLDDVGEPSPKKEKVGKILPTKPPLDKSKIDFSMPLRPFVIKYSKGMSGPKKFTLVLSYLAGGSLEKRIELAEIEKTWDKMTGILGMKFNRFYSQTAKDSDWVTSEKKGTYSLRPLWMEIFD